MVLTGKGKTVILMHYSGIILENGMVSRFYMIYFVEIFCFHPLF